MYLENLPEVGKKFKNRVNASNYVQGTVLQVGSGHSLEGRGRGTRVKCLYMRALPVTKVAILRM